MALVNDDTAYTSGLQKITISHEFISTGEKMTVSVPILSSSGDDSEDGGRAEDRMKANNQPLT